MANKAVKDIKKKGRHLRRTIRKTLGTLFLVSALVVAAIPVDNLQAFNEAGGIVSLAEDRDENDSKKPDCTVPEIPNDAKVYTTEDRKLQFVYFQQGNGGDWTAIITGFGSDYVEGGEVNIPNKVDAYRQYNANTGQTSGYAAVGKSGNFLYYRQTSVVQHTVDAKDYSLYSNNNWAELTKRDNASNRYIRHVSEAPITNADGTTTAYSVGLEEETGNYIPCYLAEKNAWEKLENERIYYYAPDPDGTPADTKPTNSGFTEVGTKQEYQRIQGVEINYISKQKWDDKESKWVDITNGDDGVFAGTSNIAELSLGENFLGVGNYAFYQSGINNIKFYNGLTTIGEGAFKDCIQLQKIELDNSCPLRAIGVSAFEGCRSLAEISLPWSVRTIGDSAFKGCDALQKIDLCNEGSPDPSTAGVNNLREVGFDVFENCAALESVTFPDTCEGPIYMSTFKGCTSLKYICSRNKNMIFKEDSIVTYDNFKEMLGEGTRVNGEFYFEGLENSELHKLCKENCFAFSYIGERVDGFGKKDRYELTLKDEEGGGKNTFVVTSGEHLVTYNYTDTVKSLSIPAKIGPHKVSVIDPSVFANYCNLETVVIPEGVSEIGKTAFQGCHKLTNVIFLHEAGENVTIGEDAFRTQNFSGTAHKCGGTAVETEADSSPTRKLAFTGLISPDFGPYQYAMTEKGGTYNSGGQADSYIMYYSGWPQNLEVKYNDSTKMSELVNFPALSELSGYDSGRYKYLALPGAEKVEGTSKTVYEDAMQTAYNAYKAGASLTPNQQAVIDAALNLVIPEGVKSVKEGLIYQKTEKDADPNKTVTAYNLDTIKSGQYNANNELIPETGTFAGSKYLKGVYLVVDSKGNGTTKIEDHAFEGCEKLSSVSIPRTVTDLGICPFYGCESLKNVDFPESEKYSCVDSIIYEDADGIKSVVECLPGRVGSVRASELKGVDALKKEAFRGSNVIEVDLKESEIKALPDKAFADTEKLYKVSVPYVCETLGNYLFENSTLTEFVTSSQLWDFAENAFSGLVYPNADVRWVCEEGTRAETYGKNRGFNVTYEEEEHFYKVEFQYWDSEQQAEVTVPAEEPVSKLEDVKYPFEVGTDVDMNGRLKRLSEWKHVPQEKDTWLFIAMYDTPQWNVTFVNAKGKEIKVVKVDHGEDVNENDLPVPGENDNFPETDDSGKPFAGWDPAEALERVRDHVTVRAYYGESTASPGPGDGTPNPSGDPNSSASPGPGGQTPTPGPGGQTPGPGQTATPGPGGNVPQPDGTFELKVHGGSGSGFYQPGSQIIITADAAPEGQKFVGWDISPAATVVTDKTLSVTILTMPSSDVAALAKFESKSGSDEEDDGKLYSLQVLNGSGSGTYPAGTQVIITANTAPENQEFTGWDISPAESVVVDKTKVSTIITMPASDAAAVANFAPKDGASSSPSPTPAPSSLHSLIVHNGSGSGSFATGAQIVIVANDPAPGQEFTGWTVSPDSTVITDKTLPGAVITMPDNDVAVIANYKSNGTGSGNTSSNNNSGNNNNNNNSGSNNNSNTNRPSTGGTTSTTPPRGGTTVVIDKNGLSNTGVVSATVNGSSDNFTIKITESSDATEAIVKALMAEYGSLDDIKYFPMDISLYDSTGNTKITDTTGLSVSITLPLPDSLINYAGNNKVAGVVNDRLDKLTPRFTTINGVSCVTFTAEHFSPYVIYVDVTNLSDGTVTDTTPTTGDGIHPKWFLSIGLACLSFVMFMIKDGGKTPAKKRKVKVRA